MTAGPERGGGGRGVRVLARVGVDIAVAAAAWVAALGPWRPSLAVALAAGGACGLVAVGVGPRGRPLPAAVVVMLFVAALAGRAEAGLVGVEPGPITGPLTLVADPEVGDDGWVRAEGRLAGHRLLVETRSPAAHQELVDALAGERFVVRGTVRALSSPSAWTRSRHLAGRLRVERIDATAPGSAAHRLANAVRRRHQAGAASLAPEHRALLDGLVFGDDRAQPPAMVADFRASGLTHLLAVSGQNVAFVLAVAGPVLKRMRLWPRLWGSVLVVGVFALLTRFEPSVLRASVVAAATLGATTIGRPLQGARALAWAVTALLLVDPLLAHSLGFRLSVAASAGMLLLARPLAQRLPGPDWLRDGLAVTASAQVAVAPVLVPVLGPLPLASLPANLLAGPVAGLLMVWGLTAGSLAAVLGGWPAALLHIPSRLGLEVLTTIARLGAQAPLGRAGLPAVAALGAAAVLIGRSGGDVDGRGFAERAPPGAEPTARWRPSGPVLTATGAAVGSLALGSMLWPRAGSGIEQIGYGAELWTDGRVAVVVIDHGTAADDLVAALRRRHVVAVGVAVLRSNRSSVVAVLGAVAEAVPVATVVAGPGSRWPGAVTPAPGTELRVGRLVVTVDEVGPPLTTRVGWARGP